MRDQDAGQIRPIRALLRGLEALEALNDHDGLTVSQVAALTHLPRTTAYRVLETLCTGGFVERDDGDERYRPMQRVRRLASGYRYECWIYSVAEPVLIALCRQILWPLHLSTLTESGALRIRLSTDDLSPLALARYAPGRVLGLLDTPSGIMRLACASPQSRDALLALEGERGACQEKIALARVEADKAAELGYALDLRPVDGEAGLATPVYTSRDGLAGILCMRFIQSALSPQAVIDGFLGSLRTASTQISAAANAAHTQGGVEAGAALVHQD